MFQLLGVFAEFERAMIQERVRAGLARARAAGKDLGKTEGLNSRPERTEHSEDSQAVRSEPGEGPARAGHVIPIVRVGLYAPPPGSTSRGGGDPISWRICVAPWGTKVTRKCLRSLAHMRYSISCVHIGGRAPAAFE
jgi:hypothetical protein